MFIYLINDWRNKMNTISIDEFKEIYPELNEGALVHSEEKEDGSVINVYEEIIEIEGLE